MDSYDNLKLFCGSERGGVSLDELSFFINIFMVFQYNLPLADFNSSKFSFILIVVQCHSDQFYSSSNETPPLSDPQNNFKLSYESIEKAEILNKYVCSISNLNDENKCMLCTCI
jgi:hypothetical protein